VTFIIKYLEDRKDCSEEPAWLICTLIWQFVTSRHTFSKKQFKV